jgi:hypothetical protein
MQHATSCPLYLHEWHWKETQFCKTTKIITIVLTEPQSAILVIQVAEKHPVQHGLKGLLALAILLLPRFIATYKDEWWSCSQYPQLLNIFVPVSMLQMHLYTQVMLILVTWNNNRLLGYCTRRVDAPGWLEHVFFPMHLYHTIWSNDL